MIKIVRSSSTNAEVTDYYLDVIASLMEACGEGYYYCAYFRRFC